MKDEKQKKEKVEELENEELEEVQGAGPKYTIEVEETEERIRSTRVGGDELKRSRFSTPR
jgi:hypothetical protein